MIRRAARRAGDWLADRPPPAIAATVLALGAGWLTLRTPVLTGDTWWHLTTGRIILERRALPATDLFSFTAGSHEWIQQQWAADVLFAAVERLAGLGGLAVLHAALVVVVFASAAWLYRRETSSWWAPGVLALAVTAGISNLTLRANLLSFPLLLAALWLARRRHGRAWVAAPLFAVWANVHGLFLMGVGTVAVVAGARWLAVAAGRADADRTGAAHAAWTLLWAALGSLLNPYGARLYTYGLEVVSTARTVVSEWMPPEPGEVTTIAFLALVVLTVAGLSLAERRPSPADVALAGAFTVLGVTAVRNVAPAALVLGHVAVRTLPHVALPRLEALGGRPPATRGFRAAAATVAVAATAVLTIVPLGRALAGPDRVAAHAGDEYPVDSLQRLQRRAGPVRLLTDSRWAAAAIHIGWPDVRVALDGRVDVYGSELVADYQRVIAGRQGWRRWLTDQGVTHVLVRDSRALAGQLARAPGWRATHRERTGAGATAVTFRRVVSES